MLKPLGIIPLRKLNDDSASTHLGRYKQEQTHAFFNVTWLSTVTHSLCE